MQANHSLGATLAGLVCVGIGTAVLETYGPEALYILVGLFCGPIIISGVYTRIRYGYWPGKSPGPWAGGYFFGARVAILAGIALSVWLTAEFRIPLPYFILLLAAMGFAGGVAWFYFTEDH